MQPRRLALVTLAAACAAALLAGLAAARSGGGRPSVVLFDNGGGDAGVGVSSQNFGNAHAALDDVAADDFAVPAGTTWRVSEVDVTGASDVTPGSVNVTFYSDVHGLPGLVRRDLTVVPASGEGGSLVLELPRPLKFRGGKTYWLSVQANMDFDTGRWLWESSTSADGNPVAWVNPLDGFGTGCTAWRAASACVGSGAPGQLFALRGTRSP